MNGWVEFMERHPEREREREAPKTQRKKNKGMCVSHGVALPFTLKKCILRQKIEL
jgi:hypothetical protein